MGFFVADRKWIRCLGPDDRFADVDLGIGSRAGTDHHRLGRGVERRPPSGAGHNEVLAAFYNQEPAARVHRSIARSAE